MPRESLVRGKRIVAASLLALTTAWSGAVAAEPVCPDGCYGYDDYWSGSPDVYSQVDAGPYPYEYYSVEEAGVPEEIETCVSDDDCPVPLTCKKGECEFDPESVEANPDCIPFCDVVIECEGTGEHVVCQGSSSGRISSDGDSSTLEEVVEEEFCDVVEGPAWDEKKIEEETEECVAMCSAVLLVEGAKETWSDLMDCVVQHGSACDEVEAECDDELEAAKDAVDDLFGGEKGGDDEEPTADAPRIVRALCRVLSLGSFRT